MKAFFLKNTLKLSGNNFQRFVVLAYIILTPIIGVLYFTDNKILNIVINSAFLFIALAVLFRGDFYLKRVKIYASFFFTFVYFSTNFAIWRHIPAFSLAEYFTNPFAALLLYLIVNEASDWKKKLTTFHFLLLCPSLLLIAWLLDNYILIGEKDASFILFSIMIFFYWMMLIAAIFRNKNEQNYKLVLFTTLAWGAIIIVRLPYFIELLGVHDYYYLTRPLFTFAMFHLSYTLADDSFIRNSRNKLFFNHDK